MFFADITGRADLWAKHCFGAHYCDKGPKFQLYLEAGSPIRKNSRLLPLILLLLSSTLLSACGSNPIVRRKAVIITRQKILKNSDADANAPPGADTWDHWLRELNEFMSPAEMRAHLAIPAEQRLRLRSQRLMDLQLRKDLLDSVRTKLSAKEVRTFRQLQSYEACLAFVKGVQKRSR